MALKIGNTEISDLKLGTTDVQKLYKGTNLIWEKNVITSIQRSYYSTSDTYRCSASFSASIIAYSNQQTDIFQLNDKIYTDSGGSILFDGGGQWYRLRQSIANSPLFVYKINSLGVVIEVHNCAQP